MEWRLTSSSDYNAEPTVIVSGSTSKCLGGHTWTCSGVNTISEGTLCDCGSVKYQNPKYCQACGHQL